LGDMRDLHTDIDRHADTLTEKETGTQPQSWTRSQTHGEISSEIIARLPAPADILTDTSTDRKTHTDIMIYT